MKRTMARIPYGDYKMVHVTHENGPARFTKKIYLRQNGKWVDPDKYFDRKIKIICLYLHKGAVYLYYSYLGKCYDAFIYSPTSD